MQFQNERADKSVLTILKPAGRARTFDVLQIWRQDLAPGLAPGFELVDRVRRKAFGFGQKKFGVT